MKDSCSSARLSLGPGSAQLRCQESKVTKHFRERGKEVRVSGLEGGCRLMIGR